MEWAIVYFVVATAIVSLFIFSQLRMLSAWRDLPFKHKAAAIVMMPLAVAIMLLFMIPVIVLAGVVNIIGVTYTLFRYMLLGKRPPPKTVPDPGREAGG